MTEREFLERFDRRLERQDRELAEIRAENRAGRERYEELVVETREYYGGLVKDTRDAFQQMLARIDRTQRDVSAELRDLRDESRAQREALLQLIDRLGPGPSAAGA